MTTKTAEEVIREAEEALGHSMPAQVRRIVSSLIESGLPVDFGGAINETLRLRKEKEAHAPRAATFEELKPLLFVRADGFNPGDIVGWRDGLAKPSAFFPKDGRAVVTRVLSTPTNRIDDDSDHYELRNVVLGFVLPCDSDKCDGDHIFELAFDGRRLKVLEAFDL